MGEMMLDADRHILMPYLGDSTRNYEVKKLRNYTWWSPNLAKF